MIGTASDGYYYFLGMKKLHSVLFNEIEWSTDSVFEQTVTICNHEKLTFKLLPLLNDIDEEADWLRITAQYK